MSLLVDPLRYITHPQFSGLLLRHTTEELRELVWKSQELYPKIIPNIKWSERKYQWEVPGGGRLWMSYLDRDEDVLRYQGQSFCVARGTPVLMEDGSYKAIESVEVGERVATLEGSSTVSYKSPALRKSLVKMRVYDASGILLTTQIHPDTHPTALLSSKPLLQLHDSFRKTEQFQKSPIQWLSYTQLQCLNQENPDYSVFQEDDRIGCKGFAGDNPKKQQPQRLFYPVVLHAPHLHQTQASAAIQCCTSRIFSKLFLEKDQEISAISSDQQRLDELPQQLRGHNEQRFHPSLRGDDDARLDSQKVEGLKCRCWLCVHQCDEQLRSDSRFDQCGVHTQDDVGQPAPACRRVCDTGCIHECNRYQLSQYTHPYTKEQRDLKAPVVLGFVEFVPFDPPDVDVFDLTVKDHNHYITFGGIINQNCAIYFDELTQWPTPFAWNYMRSRLRTTSPDLPVYMRATTNPGNRGHCVPFGEVLTRKGWVDIKDIKVGTDVVTMDQSMRMFFTPVSDVVKEHYVGPMIKYKQLMAFTENHRLPVFTDNGFEIKPYTELPERFDVVRAGKYLRFDQINNIPFVIRKYKGPTVRKKPQPLKLSDSNYCEFLAWWLAEGETDDVDSYVILRKKNGRHADLIDAMLQRCGFNYETTDNTFRIFSPDWWRHLRQFGDSKDRYVPTTVKHNGCADVFINSIMAADGYWFKKGERGIFYTSSKRLQDDFAEMAVLRGYTVRCAVRHRPPRTQPSYSVAISKLRRHSDLSKALLTQEHFEGEVYCLTVPQTEAFFIRQNGFVWLSGNTWVKKMFIDPAPPGKAFWATDIDTGETLTYPKGHAREGEPLFKRRFIPAKLSDNPYLAESGDYEAMLLSLPEHQRRQLLDGDWDVAEGAAFSEFNRAKHVIEPFKIPSEWPRFRACDYGYSSWSAVLWLAVAPDETLYVYRELYVTGVLAEDLAKMVLESEKGEKVRYGVLDSSCWAKRGDTGPSIAERMILKGCKWRPADRSAGSRIAGKNEIHRRLQVDDFTGIPRLQIFNTCTQLIADLPSIPLDKKNPEDIDTNYHSDHLYDALRYAIMSRPRSGSVFDFNQEQRNRWVNPVDKKFGY